jgi:glycosyltransferase involved in cell wall biosynthesis
MVAVSIVIITKNTADILPGCIEKARAVTDDIIVVENSVKSSNITLSGCRLLSVNWDGYGNNKNKGIKAAKYDWVLSIDSDEIPDDELINSLHHLDYSNPAVVYDIRFRSHFGQKIIRHGSWGRDHHIRLFNRNLVSWSDTMVHEMLLLPHYVETKKITTGSLHHYSVKDADAYRNKGGYYARLGAKEYFNSGKKINGIKLHFSPLFGFLRNYIFYLGFLDGRAGWDIASISFKNTRLKYRLLNQMKDSQQLRQMAKDAHVIDYRQKITI